MLHVDLAHAEASRYRSRGMPLDDLRQVAALALTKATRGYDVTTGHDFLSYAVPTIRGELRKHFRDHGWMIRPPGGSRSSRRASTPPRPSCPTGSAAPRSRSRSPTTSRSAPSR